MAVSVRSGQTRKVADGMAGTEWSGVVMLGFGSRSKAWSVRVMLGSGRKKARLSPVQSGMVWFGWQSRLGMVKTGGKIRPGDAGIWHGSFGQVELG